MITSERHSKAFLGGVERFLGNEHSDLIPKSVPKILLACYQEELIRFFLLDWSYGGTGLSTLSL